MTCSHPVFLFPSPGSQKNSVNMFFFLPSSDMVLVRSGSGKAGAGEAGAGKACSGGPVAGQSSACLEGMHPRP